MGFFKNLSKKITEKRMVVKLQRQTELLTRKDITLWRMAWQRAINVENPRRNRLYEIYTDTTVDSHVRGCMEQRRNMDKKGLFFLNDKTGKTDYKATELLNTQWFSDFEDYVIDTVFYGHSLIEFGNVIEENGKLTFDKVELIPRKHVRPESGMVVKNQNDMTENGIAYKDIPFVIEAGRPDDLGLLLGVAREAISKKNAECFWDGFTEIFGMPIRIAKTTSRDENERGKLFDMLSRMGSGFFGVFPEGTEVEIVSSGNSDAFNVYDRRIDRAEKSISKCILGQTMTIDSGSSLSQSQVHLEILKNIINADKTLIKNIVNNKLLPMMLRFGFPVEGLTFEWDETEHYSAEDIRNVEQNLISGGYEIDPKYFVDKYGIPVTGKTQSALSLKGPDSFFA